MSSPSDSPPHSRRRLNETSDLDITDADLTDAEQGSGPGSPSSSQHSQDAEERSVSGRPYEIGTAMQYDARGTPPDYDITVQETSARMACLELQLDPTPGKRYRGAHRAGLVCWLHNLPVYSRAPTWGDVAAALARHSPDSFEEGGDDTTGLQTGHLQVLSYIMALRMALQNQAMSQNSLQWLEELELRVMNATVDLAGLFMMMQVCIVLHCIVTLLHCATPQCLACCCCLSAW